MPTGAPGARPPQKGGRGAWGADGAAARRGAPANVPNLDASEDPPLPSRSVPKTADGNPTTAIRKPAWGPQGAWAKPASLAATAATASPVAADSNKQADAAADTCAGAVAAPQNAWGATAAAAQPAADALPAPVDAAEATLDAPPGNAEVVEEVEPVDEGVRQAVAADGPQVAESQGLLDAEIKQPPATRPLSREDMETLEILGAEERQMFRALHKQVADEAEVGGPRTRYSILKNFVHMTSQQMELCIDLYQQHMARLHQQQAAAKPVVPEVATGEADADTGPPPPAPGLEPRAASPAPGLEPQAGSPGGAVKLPPQPTGQAPIAPPASPMRSAVNSVDDAESNVEVMDTSAQASAPSPEVITDAPLQSAVTESTQDVPCVAAEEEPAMVTSTVSPPVAEAAATPQSRPGLEWVRKKAFQLRMTTVQPDVLASTLENLSVEQLVDPFSELKMWLGLDEDEPLAPALQQLIKEYRAAIGGS